MAGISPATVILPATKHGLEFRGEWVVQWNTPARKAANETWSCPSDVATARAAAWRCAFAIAINLENKTLRRSPQNGVQYRRSYVPANMSTSVDSAAMRSASTALSSNDTSRPAVSIGS